MMETNGQQWPARNIIRSFFIGFVFVRVRWKIRLTSHPATPSYTAAFKEHSFSKRANCPAHYANPLPIESSVERFTWESLALARNNSFDAIDSFVWRLLGFAENTWAPIRIVARAPAAAEAATLVARVGGQNLKRWLASVNLDTHFICELLPPWFSKSAVRGQVLQRDRRAFSGKTKPSASFDNLHRRNPTKITRLCPFPISRSNYTVTNNLCQVHQCESLIPRIFALVR